MGGAQLPQKQKSIVFEKKFSSSLSAGLNRWPLKSKSVNFKHLRQTLRFPYIALFWEFFRALCSFGFRSGDGMDFHFVTDFSTSISFVKLSKQLMFLSSVCHIWADEKFTFFLNSFFLLHFVEKNLRQIFQLFIYACKLDIVEENGFF